MNYEEEKSDGLNTNEDRIDKYMDKTEKQAEYQTGKKRGLALRTRTNKNRRSKDKIGIL